VVETRVIVLHNLENEPKSSADINAEIIALEAAGFTFQSSNNVILVFTKAV
jgi:hypothetical protein